MSTRAWLIGLGGTWLVLAVLVDIPDTAPLASALALSIAGAATMYQLVPALRRLGVG